MIRVLVRDKLAVSRGRVVFYHNKRAAWCTVSSILKYKWYWFLVRIDNKRSAIHHTKHKKPVFDLIEKEHGKDQVLYRTVDDGLQILSEKDGSIIPNGFYECKKFKKWFNN